MRPFIKKSLLFNNCSTFIKKRYNLIAKLNPLFLIKSDHYLFLIKIINLITTNRG